MFSLGMGPTETPGETPLEVSPIFPYKNINKLGFLILDPPRERYDGPTY